MKDLIRTIFLTAAIYFGSFAANSDDVNITDAVICCVACSLFVMTKDKN